MESFLRTAGQVIATLLLILFVLAAAVSLYATAADVILLRPATYQRALAAQNVYARATALVGRQLAGIVSDSDPDAADAPPAFLRLLTPDDWQAILAQLLPPSYIQAQTEQVIADYLAYFEPTPPAEPPAISLVEPRERLVRDAGATALARLLRALPPCSELHLAVLLTNPSAVDIWLACRPPVDFEPFVITTVQGLLDVTGIIPDQVRLPEPAFAQPDGPNIGALRLIVRFSPLLPLLLLLGVALFGAQTWPEAFGWWGAALLAAGVVSVLAAVGLWVASDWLLLNRVVPQLPAVMTADVRATALSVVRAVRQSYLLAAGSVGLGLTLLGTVGLLLARQGARRRY